MQLPIVTVDLRQLSIITDSSVARLITPNTNGQGGREQDLMNSIFPARGSSEMVFCHIFSVLLNFGGVFIFFETLYMSSYPDTWNS